MSIGKDGRVCPSDPLMKMFVEDTAGSSRPAIREHVDVCVVCQERFMAMLSERFTALNKLAVPVYSTEDFRQLLHEAIGRIEKEQEGKPCLGHDLLDAWVFRRETLTEEQIIGVAEHLVGCRYCGARRIQMARDAYGNEWENEQE